MVRGKVIVKNETGLHARPASEFVKIASTFACEIDVDVEGESVSGKSIIGILGMGVTQGSEISIVCDGDDEDEALKTLVDFVKSFEEV